jgi:hypothetical protein
MEYKTLVLEQQSEKEEREYLAECNFSPPDLPDGYGVILQCTIIRDLAGVTSDFLRPEPFALLRLSLEETQGNYPETLSKLHIINAPWLFATIWHFAILFVDSRWVFLLILTILLRIKHCSYNNKFFVYAHRSVEKVTVTRSGGSKVLKKHVSAENIPTYLGGLFDVEGTREEYDFDQTEFGLLHLFKAASTSEDTTNRPFSYLSLVRTEFER